MHHFLQSHKRKPISFANRLPSTQKTSTAQIITKYTVKPHSAKSKDRITKSPTLALNNVVANSIEFSVSGCFQAFLKDHRRTRIMISGANPRQADDPKNIANDLGRFLSVPFIADRVDDIIPGTKSLISEELLPQEIQSAFSAHAARTINRLRSLNTERSLHAAIKQTELLRELLDYCKKADLTQTGLPPIVSPTRAALPPRLTTGERFVLTLDLHPNPEEVRKQIVSQSRYALSLQNLKHMSHLAKTIGFSAGAYILLTTSNATLEGEIITKLMAGAFEFCSLLYLKKSFSDMRNSLPYRSLIKMLK